MVDLETLVAPVAEPVSLPEARAWLRLGTDGDDAVLTALIAAARSRFERQTGKALLVRTVRERFAPLPRTERDGTVMLLPALGPLTSVLGATIVGTSGSETAAAPGFVTPAGRHLRLAYRVDGLVLTYTAGMPGPQEVDPADRVAVLETLTALYAARDRQERPAEQQEPRL
jgi:uncharacterized phiE125 gp8 family phage protein